jgi:RNA polymerase sigma-70 factor, ECF subfamily
VNKSQTGASNPKEGGTEKELVAALRQGSEEAFRQLVDRYRDRLYRMAHRMVRNEDEALDIAQETFVRAHKSLSRFAGRSSIYTWLYRIARNLALDRLRRRNAHWHVSLDEQADENGSPLLERLPGKEATPDEAAAEREMMEKVRNEMDTLSDKHRIVIELREFENMSYQDIADEIGCSVGTVMSRLHYARNYLAERLSAYMDTGEGQA